MSGTRARSPSGDLGQYKPAMSSTRARSPSGDLGQYKSAMSGTRARSPSSDLGQNKRAMSGTRARSPSGDLGQNKRAMPNMWMLIRDTAQRYISKNKTSSSVDLHKDLTSTADLTDQELSGRRGSSGLLGDSATSRKSNSSRENRQSKEIDDRREVDGGEEMKGGDDVSRERVGRKQGDKGRGKGHGSTLYKGCGTQLASDTEMATAEGFPGQHQPHNLKSSSFSGKAMKKGGGGRGVRTDTGETWNNKSTVRSGLPCRATGEDIGFPLARKNTYTVFQLPARDGARVAGQHGCLETVQEQRRTPAQRPCTSGQGSTGGDLVLRDGATYFRNAQGFTAQDDFPLIWEESTADRESALLMASTRSYATDDEDSCASDDEVPVFRSRTFTLLEDADTEDRRKLEVDPGGPSTSLGQELTRKGTYTVMDREEYVSTKLKRKGTYVVMDKKALGEEDERYTELIRKGTFMVLGGREEEKQ